LCLKTSKVHFSCNESVYSVLRVGSGCWSYYHQLTLRGVVSVLPDLSCSCLSIHPLIYWSGRGYLKLSILWDCPTSGKQSQHYCLHKPALNPVSLINQLMNSATTCIFLWHEVQWARWVDQIVCVYEWLQWMN
jgi:hypothetical protein